MKRSSRIAWPLVLTAVLALAWPAIAEETIPARPSELKFAPLDFKVPTAKPYRHELSNGIPVYVAEDHALPLVDISILLRAGSFVESKTGQAALTGTMLRRGGAGEMTAEAFDEAADFLATNINAYVGETEAGASMDCITQNLDESLQLFFTMMKSPRFQQDRIALEKDGILEDMKQRNDRPQSIAGREWGWLMRGDHFTARVMTAGDLDALTREDLVTFHKNYWRPENMIIAVSGDVDTRAILADLERQFADWKVAGPDVPWPPPAPDHTPVPGVYYVKKDIPQGRVSIGQLGYQRKGWNDKEPYVISIMNDILGGGGFTSRLTKRIRSDEGLAYSAGSQYGTGLYWPGTFSAFFQTKSETVALASKITLEEIERIRAEPVRDEELRTAKNSFIDSFPRRFESAAQIVGTFADDEYEGRPHEYWKEYQDQIRAVTKEQVQAAARKHLSPDKLVFLIVGNWDEIVKGDADGRASMAEFYGGKATELPLRDPLTLQPIN